MRTITRPGTVSHENVRCAPAVRTGTASSPMYRYGFVPHGCDNGYGRSPRHHPLTSEELS